MKAHTFSVQSPEKGFSIQDDKLLFAGGSNSNGFVDYERAHNVTVVVRAADKAGAYVDQELVLEIEDGNDAPYFVATEYVVDENSKTGVEVVAFELGDDDMLVDKPWLKERKPQRLTLEAEERSGNTLDPFKLVGHTLVLASNVDHEETAFYKFEVVVLDDGSTECPPALGIASERSCCKRSCGKCGGARCGERSGGSSGCCEGDIMASNRPCSRYSPPCVISGNTKPAKTTEVCTVTVRDTGEPPSLVKLTNNRINEMASRSATTVGSVVGQVVIFDEDLVIQPTVAVGSPTDQIFRFGELSFKTVHGSDWYVLYIYFP